MSQQTTMTPASRGPLQPRDAATIKRESWRPIHAGEAFQRSHSYSRQLLAQRLYYAAVREAQRRAVMAATGRPPARNEEMLAKAQLGQLYSDLPARFAALSGVGHTAFMEYNQRIEARPVAQALNKEAMKTFHQQTFVTAPPDLGSFLQLANLCTAALDTRLTLRALGNAKGLAAVEHYRVFLAAQQPLPPTTTGQMVRGLVLFADLLFPLLSQSFAQMHPALQVQYRAAASVVRIKEPLLERVPDDRLIDFMVEYGEQLIATLGSFLPPKQQVVRRPQRIPGTSSLPSFVQEQLRQMEKLDPRVRELVHEAANRCTELDRQAVAPLDAPPPPEVEEGSDSQLQSLAQRIAPEAALSSEARVALAALQSDLKRVLEEANDKQDLVADPRPEQVERMLRRRPFRSGTLEGNPARLTEVSRVLGWDDEFQGGASVFQEVLVPPSDPSEYEALRAQAAPLIERLRRLVYPDTSKRPTRRRYCRSGSPDPVRLPLFQVSDSIYRRTEHRPSNTDRVETPSCVLLACDGSGSMRSGEFSLLKLLTCAFAEALHDARLVTVLAGLYHTAAVGDALEGPTVKWLLHPRLTPSVSTQQAARAITSLPPSGTGVNHDAVSLTHMLDEARAVVPRSTIYLINLTDGRFNARERGGDGTREMESFLEAAKDLPDGKLHYTVVAIGKPEDYELKGADRIVTVQKEMLQDKEALVERIASFVARSLAGRQEEAAQARR